jgi:protein-disulfide isomerase
MVAFIIDTSMSLGCKGLKKTISFYALAGILVLCSCNADKENNEKAGDEVVAVINNDSVYYSDIDKQVKQQIFDELNRIYVIRQLALDETIDERLIEQAARKKSLSKSNYLENYFQRYLNKNSIMRFASYMQYDSFGINDLQRNIRTLNIHSQEGEELLVEKYKKYLRNKLVDSLKAKAVIISKLKPPTNFEIDVNELNVHYTGNLNASTSLIIISDFECEFCREYHNIYEYLFKKYHSKIKLGFVNFSPYISICARAAESAAKQGKFWEMHNQLFSEKQLPDTLKIYQMARQINLNMSNFKSDFYSKEVNDLLNDNSQKCIDRGLFATPTIIVNGNVLFNSSSKEYIEKMIEETLIDVGENR